MYSKGYAYVILKEGSLRKVSQALRINRFLKLCAPPTAVGDVLVALLDSEDRELVYSTCGVLLNVMIVPDLRPLLASNNGVRKLGESGLVYMCVCCTVYSCTYIRIICMESVCIRTYTCVSIIAKENGEWYNVRIYV